ncbi:MAG: choice-of-anchor Q domain-containing protein [bacterium]
MPCNLQSIDIRRRFLTARLGMALLFSFTVNNTFAQITWYVVKDNPNEHFPYTNWSVAAASIQTAINAADNGDSIVVSNGVYDSGGVAGFPAGSALPNRVAIYKGLTIRSLNGPTVTTIRGQGPNGSSAIRCAYMTNGASLMGFTLTNGATLTTGLGGSAQVCGGAVWCESVDAVLSNCVITRSTALSDGGGVYSGTLRDCTLTWNSSANSAGGARGAQLYNCTLSRNTSGIGGGAAYGNASNCTFSYNSAPFGGGAAYAVLQACSLSRNTASQYGGGCDNCTGYDCTIANNTATWDGGGTYYGSYYNCTLSGNTAANYGGGTSYGAFDKCTFSGNTAQYGGGGSYASMVNCTLTGNKASEYGGGAYGGGLTNCTLSGNQAYTVVAGHGFGGGISDGKAVNCSFSKNTATIDGGGAYRGTVYNCTFLGNKATQSGGGISGSTVYNSVFAGNEATFTDGGGSCSGLLYNCTMTGNSAGYGKGGGASGSRLYNCILYYNTAQSGANWASAGCTNCCTTPNPGGIGNVTNEPCFMDLAQTNLHLRGESPCIDKGTNFSWMSIANDPRSVDIDGNTRILNGKADIGAFEYPFCSQRYVSDGNPNAYFPYANWTTAAESIQTAVNAARNGEAILVGDGIYDVGGMSGCPAGSVLSNRVAIYKALKISSLNGPSVTTISGKNPNGAAAVRCVYMTNGASLAGFTITNGATRTTGDSIKDCSGGGIWCQSTNAILSNCVIRGNTAAQYGGGVYGGTLRNSDISGNGASWNGGGACSSVLFRCTLNQNTAAQYGGGAYYGTLQNCELTGNTASWDGGGAYYGTLFNCTLSGNTGSQHGGGAYGAAIYNSVLAANSGGYGAGASDGVLYNCTVVSNTASLRGGGTRQCTLYNSIVYFNNAPIGTNCDGAATYVGNCTVPDPGGVNNITNDPAFVDLTTLNLRLNPSSPCVDVGTNLAWMTDPTSPASQDRDGNARMICGTVDIGAFESTNATTPGGIPRLWFFQYHLPTDGTADRLNSDCDGAVNADEYTAGTDPTNSTSFFHIVAVSNSPSVVVCFTSCTNREYTLLSNPDLSLSNGWSIVAGQSNVIGGPETSILTDTNDSQMRFYRVRVSFP